MLKINDLTHFSISGLYSQKEVEIMNKYESIIIINPNCTEEAIKALESKFTGLINENGKVESVENMGKKRLAYEIQKMKEGFFYFIQFDAAGTAPAEIEARVRIMDNVLRYLVVRQDA